MRSLGWLLQVFGLVAAGAGLLIGMQYGTLRLELGMLAVGGVCFLIGRRLYQG